MWTSSISTGSVLFSVEAAVVNQGTGTGSLLNIVFVSVVTQVTDLAEQDTQELVEAAPILIEPNPDLCK